MMVPLLLAAMHDYRTLSCVWVVFVRPVREERTMARKQKAERVPAGVRISAAGAEFMLAGFSSFDILKVRTILH